MKYFVWIILLGAIAGGGYVWYNAREKAAAAAAIPTLQTDTVTRRTVEKLISANGKVASNRDVDIKCQASGSIQTLPYTDVGAEVQPGALLCQLDPIDEQHLLDTAQAVVVADQARLEEAKKNWEMAKLSLVTTRQRDEAALASAQARASQAKAKLERTKQLFDAKLASQEDLETDQTNAAQTAADVETSQAAIAELDQQKISVDTKEQQIAESQSSLDQDTTRLATAQQNYGYCKVTAPKLTTDEEKDPPRWFISSLLTNIAPGYIVQSGTSGFSAGTTIMTLSDLSHIFILASVDESDVGQVEDPARGAPKQKVRITADSFPGQEFEGEVVRVATKGVNTSNVVTFEVKIEVTSPNRILLRPEMTATAKIITASREDVLSIPAASFIRGGQQGEDSAHAGTSTAPSTAPAEASATPGNGERRGGRGGRGGGGRNGGQSRITPVMRAPGAPMNGTVTVVKDDGSQETRNVTVGLSDDVYYEVIRGLEEGETVVVFKNGAESRFRNPNPGGAIMRMGGRR